MIDPEDQHPTPFIQHVAESEPQKDPGRLIFDRHLATVDAPPQTISKVIVLAVFVSDALSSSAYAIDEKHGMPLHFDSKWKIKMFLNGLGATATAIVMLVFSITKFIEGVWVVLLLIPTLVALFLLIHRHYRTLENHLSLEHYREPPPYPGRHRVIMPVSGVHQGTLDGLRYVRLLSDDVTAAHVSTEPTETEKVRRKWVTWGEGTSLAILDSPYRLFVEPLLAYLEEIVEKRQPNETTTIVVPQFIPSKRWHNALHMRTV